MYACAKSATVDGHADVAGVDVAQRHDDGRAVVAPDGAVAVVAWVVDAQLQFVDRVPCCGPEERFYHVAELRGRVRDNAVVVVVREWHDGLWS